MNVRQSEKKATFLLSDSKHVLNVHSNKQTHLIVSLLSLDQAKCLAVYISCWAIYAVSYEHFAANDGQMADTAAVKL